MAGVAIFQTLCLSLFTAMLFMSGLFVVGYRLQRYDIVDVGWGLVFIVITMTSVLFSGAADLSVIVAAMVSVWGLRLSWHIYRRFRTTTMEDKRYVAMRAKWQSKHEAVAVFFRIYMAQALLAVIVCLPVIVIAANSDRIKLPFLVVGALMWAVGFSVEAIADRQLRHFIQQPHDKGQLMTHGLWRYSRHPNYFGELLLWWGVGVVALSVPFGWIGLIGPLVISVLIIFVSGLPPTEKAFAGRVGWAEYKRRTSILIPWFVRNEMKK